MKHTYFLDNPNFTVENINFENVARDKGFKYHHKCRIHSAFIYVVSGRMQYVFSNNNKKPILVHTNELIFVPQNSDYVGIYDDENTEIKLIQFDIFGENIPSYLRVPQKIELPKIAESVNAFFKPLMTGTTIHPFYYLSKLYELLWMIDSNFVKPPSKYKKLQPAFSEIAEHFERNEKISYYASLCGISETTFRKLFHEYTGQSPITYRNHIRLNDAKRKLQSGMYTVSEVAELTGFTNLSFFTRLYKAEFGHTPKDE